MAAWWPVAGSQADQVGYEDRQWGAFSRQFQRALQDSTAETNQDGEISIAEAAASTETALERDNFNQSPTIAGPAKDVALFSTSKAGPGSQKYRTLHAVVVGINKYKQTGADLQGAVNDAKGL